MNDKITVIIPMLDFDCLAKKAIFSIKEQKYQPFELVLVVDRRRDEATSVYDQKVNSVNKYISENIYIKNKVITVSHNIGPGCARNIAQKNSDSSTNWFAFLDSDDYWERNHLSDFIVWLKNIDNKKNIIYFSGYNDVKMPYEKLRFMNFLISPRLHTPSAIMSKSNIFFNNGRHSEDISYWIELFENNYDVYCNNITGSRGRLDRFITGQSQSILLMTYNKISFLFSNYFKRHPVSVLIGVIYELLIMPTRYFRKR